MHQIRERQRQSVEDCLGVVSCNTSRQDKKFFSFLSAVVPGISVSHRLAIKALWEKQKRD